MSAINPSAAILQEKRFDNNRFFRRRLQDSRIWKQICAAGYEWAAIRLCRGYAYMVNGGRVKISSWSEKVSASYNPERGEAADSDLEYLQRCKYDYLRWFDSCLEAGLNPRAAMDILFFGCGLDEVERAYRHRHGWALKNLLQCLELYRK